MGSKYVGNKIREWRIGSGMSVTDICIEYNIQPSSWYKWENGNTIHAKTAKLLNSITKLDMDLLLSMADKEDKELDEIAAEYERTHPLIIDNKARIVLMDILKNYDRYKDRL